MQDFSAIVIDSREKSGLSPVCRSGFTLIEMLVSTTILALIMVMVVGMIQMTNKTWTDSNAKLQSFQGARQAFEAISRALGQATLNTYWGYDDPNSPTQYERKSEMHFNSGTATALALPSSLASQTHAFFFKLH